MRLQQTSMGRKSSTGGNHFSNRSNRVVTRCPGPLAAPTGGSPVPQGRGTGASPRLAAAGLRAPLPKLPNLLLHLVAALLSSIPADMADAKKPPNRKRSARSRNDVNDDTSRNEPHSAEVGHSITTTSRCSVRQLCAVIQTFNDLKKQLVREIEFHALLSLPQITSMNRLFSTWLLSKVDCDHQCLSIDDNTKIPFESRDVQYVFGIPCGPKDVLGNDSQITDKGVQYLRECIGLDGDNPRSLRAVQDFLLSDFGMNPTTYQRDCFKAAFVVYAVGSFLAPATKHDYVSTSYWGAIRCVSEIPSFNWGAYVIKSLLESARRVQADITNKRDVSSISGCHLFLQVLYLDNIWIPPFSTPHHLLPRIKDFGGEVLNGFVSALATGTGFTIHPLREPSTVCYTWKEKVTEATTLQPQQAYAAAEPAHAIPGIPETTPNQYCNPNMPTATAMSNHISTEYPAYVGTQVGDLLKLHYAKTFQHCQVFQASVLNDNLVLADRLMETLTSGVHLEQGACSRTTKKGVKKRHEDDFSVEKCIDVVDAMEELTDEQKADANELWQSEMNRQIFMKTPNPNVRLIWLKKKISQNH